MSLTQRLGKMGRFGIGSEVFDRVEGSFTMSAHPQMDYLSNFGAGFVPLRQNDSPEIEQKSSVGVGH